MSGSRRGIWAPFAQYCRQLDEFLSARGRRRGAPHETRPTFDRTPRSSAGERGRDAPQGERAVAGRGRLPGKIARPEVTGTTLKVQAVEDLRAQYPLSLHIARLPRSTFYDHRNRLARADRHAELKDAIGQAFADAKGAYGHRRVLAVLLRRGWRVSKKTVLKLMRTMGTANSSRRRSRRTGSGGPRSTPKPPTSRGITALGVSHGRQL
ncbi:MAG: transposase [Pseudonocardia sp.]|nr:transposase [Pseudonocardia sp.]